MTITHAIVYDAAEPRHELVFDEERLITGCICGFEAEGWDGGDGDSVVAHLLRIPATPTYTATWSESTDGHLTLHLDPAKGDS